MSAKERNLIVSDSQGLFCPRGGFYIDPWRPVDVAVITHAHADHARSGSRQYIAPRSAVELLRSRLGAMIPIRGVDYGEKFKLGELWVSLHPAGHILGSAQVRVEAKSINSKVWVFTGDFKRASDPSCEPFEPVYCDVLITESTFGLPIYSWQPGHKTVAEIWSWVKEHPGPSILFCYALGKAQRILAELRPHTQDKVYLHGSMERLTQIYRSEGRELVPTAPATEYFNSADKQRSVLILAPPSAHRSAWMKRFRNFQTGFASGWMSVRGHRRRRNVEKGFVLSDHADWGELLQTIEDSGAKQIYTTHGQTEVFARFLREQRGLQCDVFRTQYENGEVDGENS